MDLHRLKRWRLDRKLTQAELAAQIGVTVSAVCNYEKGRVPVWPVVLKIIEVTKGKVREGDFYAAKRNGIPVDTGNERPAAGIEAVRNKRLQNSPDTRP